MLFIGEFLPHIHAPFNFLTRYRGLEPGVTEPGADSLNRLERMGEIEVVGILENIKKDMIFGMPRGGWQSWPDLKPARS